MKGMKVLGRRVRVDYNRAATTMEGRGNEGKVIVRLPRHQHRQECMIFAGVVSTNKRGQPPVMPYARVFDWDEQKIRSFYSRMAEAFFGEKSRLLRYLMRDSLALTLMKSGS